MANRRRVAGEDLPAADEAFERSLALWHTGAAEDPGLLNAARVLGLEASLRRAQCRLPEALALICCRPRESVGIRSSGRGWGTCSKKGQVPEIRRVEAEFLDDREEIGEGADERQGRKVLRAATAAGDREEEGCLDGCQSNPLVKELGGEPAIRRGRSAGCGVRQPAVKGEHGADVGGSAHGLRLRRAAASASLSRRR